MLKFLNKTFNKNHGYGSNKLNFMLSSNEINHVYFYVSKYRDRDPYVNATITFKKDNQQEIKLEYTGHNIDEIIQRITNDMNKTE